MANRLRGGAEAVDKCGKLCRAVEMFHVEQWGGDFRVGSDGYAGAGSRGRWVFHVEHWTEEAKRSETSRAIERRPALRLTAGKHGCG
jgi:hypothetical protein